ncbi:hypothetical protein FCL49_06870 [Serratia proteamaculans]|jgi:hypothetical protein|uniref:hypothetical protein n=1 Tax=Serratia TaxID=613 RepID=UPI001576C97A|nr:MULTISPECIES: hypothetical protein [Serratia]NTX77936.1 hypothetical protein [Serratia proteamaculans]NTZ27822.1 hypothetical protein [Serratia proteamaculans]CAI0750764.1 Uncharacterised protein [Serratia quinivorans]CAI0802916.1 Uncharacterised protein [Serratia quinivorans]CAI0919708.1 Uncharacterised protein [Serratia quinivorans]
MRVSTKSLVVFLLLMYMTLLSLNGIVTVVAYMSTRALLLYKDFFAMAVPVFVLILLFARNPRVSAQCRSILILFLSMVVFSLVFILLSMLSGRFDFFRAIVQFRLELLTFGSFFFAAVLLLFEYDERVEIVTKVIKYYIIFAVLNALFAVAESSLAGLLYAVIGFDPGPQLTQFGKEYGLLLRTIQGQLRAFGLLTGPFSLSEYLFFALVLTPFVSAKHRKKYILLIVVGIAFSTSKTAIIMALLYIMFLISRRFFSQRFSLNIVTMVTMVLSLFFYVTTTNYSIYEMIFPKENAYAENSILLRTVNIEAVRADSGYSPFIGAGYAVNGNAVVGDDNTNSIPLDSMYIYMLSNYGNLGIIFLVIVASLILGILYQRTRRGLNPSVYLYWMISLSMNFVYNNPLTNYPGYIFPIIISILLLSVRKPEGSIAKRSEKTLGRVHLSH